ncbi:MAG TPA: HNH endonuclease signature motif containing protein [Myxococcaceae bacterium]|jgi:hypothetical protein
MPRLPEEQLRRLLIECLEADATQVIVPTNIEGHVEVQLRPTTGGALRNFHLAARTVTRDTRIKGVWNPRLKIQKTGLADVQHLDALLGLSLIGDQVIVVAADVARHLPVTGRSNNVQFPEDLLLRAYESGTVVHFTKPTNGEVVVAFPGELLTPFLLGQIPVQVPPQSASTQGGAQVTAQPVLSATPSPVVTTLSPQTSLKMVVRRALARDPAFAVTVRKMYKDRCAACGVSLGITEAAHLVSYALSRDNSPLNGVCLCPNHHTAFDLADLVSFGPDRTIWVNTAKLRVLQKRDLLEGFELLIGCLRPQLLPVPNVNQAQYLTQRHNLDLAEGVWKPRSAL